MLWKESIVIRDASSVKCSKSAKIGDGSQMGLVTEFTKMWRFAVAFIWHLEAIFSRFGRFLEVLFTFAPNIPVFAGDPITMFLDVKNPLTL